MYQKYVVSKLASTVIEGHNDETVVSVLERRAPPPTLPLHCLSYTYTHTHTDFSHFLFSLHVRTHTHNLGAKLFILGISI